jgi:TatD DNase family protein
MNYYIDTHAHIYLDEFIGDREAMLVRAENEGVSKIFMPNVDHTSMDAMMELEATHKGRCISMMGLHPCYVKASYQKELYLVEDWLSKRKFAAVGEIGTDLYWDKTFWEQQQDAFTIQLNLAKKYKLPVVIHCRESIDETIDLVSRVKDENLMGVFHCFGGTLAQAKKIISLGFYLGIGGVTTFKKGGLDTVLPDLSLENLVLETDSPYLAPVPFRGKRNEPSYIPLIAKRVAEIKGISPIEVRDVATKNSLKLFNMG